LAAKKFQSRARLTKTLAGLKRRGKKIVFANGCFDLLHVGHLRYLEGAKQHGDVLVVGLNSDASVRRLKGAGRPLTPLRERAEIISGLACVDYVTEFGEPSAEKTLRMLKPNIQAKGTDYTAESVPEAAVMKELGGRVVISGDAKKHSSTALMRKARGGRKA